MLLDLKNKLDNKLNIFVIKWKHMLRYNKLDNWF